MKTKTQVILLGIALILLSIACNSMRTLTWEGLNTFVGNYAHWVGFLCVLIGICIPEK